MRSGFPVPAGRRRLLDVLSRCLLVVALGASASEATSTGPDLDTTTTTDATGTPTTPIVFDPYQRVNPGGFEQRKFQLGFKVAF